MRNLVYAVLAFTLISSVAAQSQPPDQRKGTLPKMGPSSGGVASSSLRYLNGSIEPDGDPDYIRLYRDPEVRNAYLLIKRADVQGNVYEWTSEEKAAAHFAGASMYRVALRSGTQVLVVHIAFHRLGETLAADTLHPRPSEEGTCFYTDGCDSGCCTEGDNGNCYCDNCCHDSEISTPSSEPLERM